VKIYISSSYQDLREYRAAVDQALRRMGHDVIGMEQYVAEQSTPLERCLRDVRTADVYLVIVAWRYGYSPEDERLNPRKLSITELEFEEAVRSGTPVLAFLLDPEAPWPPASVDAMLPGGGESVVNFRSRLGTRYLVGLFRTPDNLASQAAAAIARQGLREQMLDRHLLPEEVRDAMAAFGHGLMTADNESALISIREMVAGAASRNTRSLLIHLKPTETWWSTRLYVLATLLESLTGVRQLVFAREDGRFAGMASPSAVRAALCAAFEPLARVDAALRASPPSGDVERDVRHTFDLWQQQISLEAEKALKVGVRLQLLARWIGEAWISRCIKIDADVGLTMIQVQQLVDSLIPDVPVEREFRPQAATPDDPQEGPVQVELMVIDRDAFALQLARTWVRTGLPRTTSW
jgi:hypothetical protein